ncbi:MAG TPA: aromatic ring-opening dioxygenase subunit LigA [Caulobacteraceae bacterium]
MSLYQLSKLLFTLNRDEAVKQRFRDDPEAVADGYALTPEERGAFLKPDIGLLYVLGVNGQILMHYAALRGVAWADYLQLMRDGVRIHGPVRAGLYAMTTSPDGKLLP